ncbi:MAG: hypothetical protein KKG59_00130 [Nanoarchaeota archaeon]|nr:hypothetical protein [Nanoarchaeota archaeon]MBU1974791.1 hypothetical protein [Nanoarchaeota archaeon]
MRKHNENKTMITRTDNKNSRRIAYLTKKYDCGYHQVPEPFIEENLGSKPRVLYAQILESHLKERRNKIRAIRKFQNAVEYVTYESLLEV